MNYYEILECQSDANFTQIKRSYQRLALQHHPDKDKSDGTSEIYLKIDEAWQTLRDPEKRKVYDAVLYETKINEQSNIFAELNASSDFNESESGTLSYPCRCGDVYEVDKADIPNESEFIVECNQCSLVVKVHNKT